MAAYTGFVDNTGQSAHYNFIELIRTVALANGWTELFYDTSTDDKKLMLKSNGLSGLEEIFIGFRTYQNPSADYYNVAVAGFIGYVPGNSFETQPGYTISGVCAHNNRIDYWIIANAQRIAFGLKVGTPVYESAYVGKILPYARPSQYPYPLVVCGMLDGVPATRFSDGSHSMGFKGNRANMKMRFVDGTWKTPQCFPWNNARIAGRTSQNRDTGSYYSITPIILSDASGIYGEFDGVYQISGFNNAVENTLNIGGKDYVVIQDVARTGFSDYIALELA